MNNSVPDNEVFNQESILDDLAIDEAVNEGIDEYNNQTLKESIIEELESNLDISERDRKWILTDLEAERALELFKNARNLNPEMTQGLTEFSLESIEEEIKKEASVENQNDDRLELLGKLLAARKSVELSKEEKINSPQKNLPPANMSTPKKMKEFHKKMEVDALFKGKPGRATKITKSEHLEATKDGLCEFLIPLEEKLKELEIDTSPDLDGFISKKQIRQKHKITVVKQMIEKIEHTVETLPSDPPETPIEQFPEWQRDLIHTERRNKEAKLKTHRDMAAAGIEFNGKYGLDAIGAVSDAYDDLHKELPGSKNFYPEEQTNIESNESTEEVEEYESKYPFFEGPEEFDIEPLYENMDFDGSIIDSLKDPRT